MPHPGQDEVQGGQEQTACVKGGACGSLVEQGLQVKRGERGPIQATGNRNKLDVERDRHREDVEELGVDVNGLATKLRQREVKLEPLRSDASSYSIRSRSQDDSDGTSNIVLPCPDS